MNENEEEEERPDKLRAWVRVCQVSEIIKRSEKGNRKIINQSYGNVVRS